MSRLHHNFKVGPHRDLTILQRRLNGRPDIGQFIAETPTVWRALNAWLERAGKLTRAELLPEMPIVETGRLDEVKIAAFLLTIELCLETTRLEMVGEIGSTQDSYIWPAKLYRQGQTLHVVFSDDVDDWVHLLSLSELAGLPRLASDGNGRYSLSRFTGGEPHCRSERTLIQLSRFIPY